MLKKIAMSMGDNEQRIMMHIILACAIVTKRGQASSNCDAIKSLRMSVCERLAEFFQAFSSRPIERDEMRVIKCSVLEAYLKDLKATNVIERHAQLLPVAPFAIVKLLAAVSRLPSLYKLLTVRVKWNALESEEHSCLTLDLLIAPLYWPGCFELMLKTIRGAILKLSELADEPMIEIPAVECERFSSAKGANFGTTLLSSRIHLLLDILTQHIEHEVATMKKPSAESIVLLGRFSDYVSEYSDVANRLATPLLICIEKRKSNEETLISMLQSMARIAPMLNEPCQYFAKLPRMFLKFDRRALRESLVSMIEGFARSQQLPERTRMLLKLIGELDAWDRTKVDEPHYERRYAAYNELMTIWASNEAVDAMVLAMLVCTHFHTISTTSDLSLRMTAGNNVRSLVEFAGRTLTVEMKHNFLETYLAPTVLIYVKHEVDAVREEAINVLIVMIKAFPENQHLHELDQFSNDDEDLDFLKNMNHIQIHRRQRAIRRLIDAVESGQSELSFSCMNKYLIPMINPYLVNFSAKFNALSDECLRLLKCAMSRAPWSKYSSFLEGWLARVEKATKSTDDEFSDKALVRIVVAVIEAFHFDVELDEAQLETDADRTDEEKEKIQIFQRVNRVILPQLIHTLDSQTHAVERSARTMESKATALHLDIQRTPIALAIVKLLVKLPEAITTRHLHGVILKLCNLMMTHSFDVRETARKTLIQIVKCLGPKYLASVITEISLTMTKGFQVHVAIYSIHSLIVAMKSTLNVGDLDSAIGVIVKLAIQDQFNAAAEEKEIGAIKAECPEAKGNRTPETMQHLGRVVSPMGIQQILAPFRDVVNEQPSAKAIQKVSDLLSKFVSGLKENDGLEASSLLTFIFKSLTADLQKMKEIEGNGVVGKAEKEIKRESCLLLPEAPKRLGAINKVVVRSRDHVFAEFFVQLYSSLLKEKKLDLDEDGMIARLNPFVPLILDCFDFKYEKLISSSLRALCSMIQIQLPAVEKNSQRIADTLFILLSDYSSIGHAGNKPSIVQLNQLIYKTFTSFIGVCGRGFLDNEKLTLLLAYAEADIMDQHKQATMFSLIKSLVKKGVQHERLAEIMDHLSETAIRSHLPNIRSQCRETLLDYIGGASDTEKSPAKYIEFFLDQLDYEYDVGRLSAAEMLTALFKNLVPKSLENVHMLCVVKLGAAIMNDESPKVVAQVGVALRSLLNTVGVAQRQETFEVICQWLETEDENARAVGIQTAVQLSFVEKETMANRLPDIVKRMRKCLFDEDVFSVNSEKSIVAFLSGLTRILCNIGKTDMFDGIEFMEALVELATCDESLRIRNASATLIGQILANCDESKITNQLAKDVCSWMCRTLRHEELDDSTAEQASKNIVFMVKLLDLNEYEVVVASIAAACRFEVKHHVKETIKRTNCFKLATALFVTADVARIDVILTKFLPHFVRELRMQGDDELLKLTQEVCALIKKRIGDENYSMRIGECQKSAASKINERKRKVRELAVTAPHDAAELRRKKNRKKAETRKRKIDAMKPHRLIKRRNREKRLAQENEED
ncbi:unnamed protein product [Caenorhabditis bovis]|uniref:Uncharacterized protein n=1 Tax=Caenorhabditis bovis TaxID=2654633 RepID=A0A8S1EUI1_9PELO|nr:unnamed protein product [Caenorhabditis bovis]